MAGKQDILKAADKLVAAQERNVRVGGLQDQTLSDRESLDEEILEDELAREDQPAPLSTRETDV